MKKVILAGGTGNLGQLLAIEFNKHGYQVIVLTRNKEQKSTDKYLSVYWDGRQLGEWASCLENADAVINLSGKSIQCRYTETNKNILIDSRVEPTYILGKAIQNSKQAPRLWINFSGVSIFENKPPFHTEESTDYADTFLAKLSQIWENTFWEANTEHTKKVCLRVSPVLSKKFGMLKELYPLAKLGLAGTVGNGQQYISWIHQTDFTRLVWWITQQKDPYHTYHACAPEALTNKDFMISLRTQVGVPFGLPLPELLARVGAWAKGVEPNLLLDSTAVITSKTLQDGFTFQYPRLDFALKNLLT